MGTNYKQLFAKQQEWTVALRKLCPHIDTSSGIYFWKRDDENGMHLYIGKASNLLQRSISHCMGYAQRIDKSIRKWGFYHEQTNPMGWQLAVIKYPKSQLDEMERKYIEYYSKDKNIDLYNIESGGTNGKTYLAERQPRKGYHEGLKQGYRNAQKYVAKLFAKNLVFDINGNPTVNKQKAYDKFKNFININENGE